MARNNTIERRSKFSPDNDGGTKIRRFVPNDAFLTPSAYLSTTFFVFNMVSAIHSLARNAVLVAVIY